MTTERADLNQRYMENHISIFCLLPFVLALYVFFPFMLLVVGPCETPFRDFAWWSKTPLHYAIMTGDASMVAHLIELGADPNSKAFFLGCCCGKTPAQWVEAAPRRFGRSRPRDPRGARRELSQW